ncbi:MAG: metallophosphoesterase [Kofleriaceae bacterium]|jgi:hypothetical protein|nr:metallophosphoesterase [Kofleriaceae bacterium]MBP9171794.1 metallophosphoesterase [Kofleriaceae bacterium]MBP9863298.1 metallophosphoesterase [Kofleriaceae bacterium]
MRTLATLFHISDLHIGDVDWAGALRADERLEPRYEDWWRHWSLFDGYFGHDHRALTHVVDALIELQRSAVNPIVVFTGDLTACGRASQFLMGATFLGSQVVLEQHNLLGLKQPSALVRSVPGNHDCWPGSGRILGPRSLAIESLFGACPRVQRVPLDGGRALVLIQLDTEANVEPWGLNRLAARGEFHGQLTRAAGLLTGDPAREVRVLVLHHTRLTNAWFSERICARTAEELAAFIADYHVDVLLTGHVHEPLVGARPVDGQRRASLEFCAGTTAQRPEPPHRWRLSKRRHARRSRHNTLLVHRVSEADDGSLHWSADIQARVDDGFASIAAAGHGDRFKKLRSALAELPTRIR